MTHTFTPSADIRRDEGPTGEFLAPSIETERALANQSDAPGIDVMERGVTSAPVSDSVPQHSPSEATEPPAAFPSLDAGDYACRFQDHAPIDDGAFDAVTRCTDIWQDGSPSRVLHRIEAPGAEDIERARRWLALSHPDVAPAHEALMVDGALVVTHHDVPGGWRLEQYVDAELPFGRAAAIALVERLATIVESLHDTGIVGLGLTPRRIGLRWVDGDPVPRPFICETRAAGDARDDVAALGRAFACALTGDPDGRPPIGGRALRRFLDAATHEDPTRRPADVEAFCRGLRRLRRDDTPRRWPRVVAVAAVVAAGALALWWTLRPAPVVNPAPAFDLTLHAGNDAATLPPPPVRVAPLDEGYRAGVADVDEKLARRETSQPSRAVDRDILAQLGAALDGRPATEADRRRVEQLDGRRWRTRALKKAHTTLERAFASGDDTASRAALESLYALDPTHAAAAFAVRHSDVFQLVEEEAR